MKSKCPKVESICWNSLDVEVDFCQNREYFLARIFNLLKIVPNCSDINSNFAKMFLKLFVKINNIFSLTFSTRSKLCLIVPILTQILPKRT